MPEDFPQLPDLFFLADGPNNSAGTDAAQELYEQWSSESESRIPTSADCTATSPERAAGAAHAACAAQAPPRAADSGELGAAVNAVPQAAALPAAAPRAAAGPPAAPLLGVNVPEIIHRVATAAATATVNALMASLQRAPAADMPVEAGHVPVRAAAMAAAAAAGPVAAPAVLAGGAELPPDVAHPKRERERKTCPSCAKVLSNAQYYVHLADIRRGGVCRVAAVRAAAQE
ncbi:hypothetical protein HYH02_009364 [Chlamydomonas schloesseri]|uniref:Uncharacterized protein n=1 Tax=Chlamydomonas schloesseri TaxID=2026947 RepID=A0A835W9L6_9CHLO|nr:hypothetical protein HYH02_009364 [Chlamydomonas schloesseri]|eukprot:KAG2443294.1 hypothetical protein HYH02_009364 [Chlamydomonas schloesseri]